jgi:hypothetical protein
VIDVFSDGVRESKVHDLFRNDRHSNEIVEIRLADEVGIFHIQKDKLVAKSGFFRVMLRSAFKVCQYIITRILLLIHSS